MSSFNSPQPAKKKRPGPSLEYSKIAAIGFGAPFGATPATTASTGFAFGTSFGAPAAQTAPPSFGAATQQTTSFGAPQTSSTFGAPQPATAFGAQQASASFGAQQGSTFGAPQPSTSFGAQQGSTAFGAAQQSTSFGAPQSSSAFGAAPNQTAPTFGAFGAQQTQQQQPPAFGSTFGASAAASAAPAFGSTFGTATTSTGSAFGTSGFGTSSLFGGGTAATTKPNLFGTSAQPSLFSSAGTAPNLFGASTTTTQAPSLFGGTAATPGLFGAGTSTTQAPSLFGGTATQSGGLFGGNFGGTTTSAPSLFGGTGGGFGMFSGGAQATTSAPMFGGFGTATQSTPAFPGFGTATPAQQVQVAAPTPTYNQMVHYSIQNVNIFGDERDHIIKKWNLLQASWGTGKGYFSQQHPPVEYTPQNHRYYFKAIAYNFIPQHDNSEGIVKLIFNKKYAELASQREVLVNGISGILGNKPNLKVSIHDIKTLSDTQAEVRIVVTEKGVTGTTRVIPATDLAAFLNQPTPKQQLASVSVTSIVALVKPSKTMMEDYLRNVPAGFDEQMWAAAIADNPNPEHYMPVPIYGFNDLKARKLKQQHEIALHKAYEQQVRNDMMELKEKQAIAIAKITELKHRFLHLQHRTLKILVKQESIRKSGLAIQPEEEYLKGKLESEYAQLRKPTQFRGQLNELMSSVKLMDSNPRPAQPRYKLLPESQNELKDFLQLQQEGIAKLVSVVKEDLQALNIINEGVRSLQPRRHL